MTSAVLTGLFVDASQGLSGALESELDSHWLLSGYPRLLHHPTSSGTGTCHSLLGVCRNLSKEGSAMAEICESSMESILISTSGITTDILCLETGIKGRLQNRSKVLSRCSLVHQSSLAHADYRVLCVPSLHLGKPPWNTWGI